MSQKLAGLAFVFLFSTIGLARGQQSVSSITQSRLFNNPAAPGTVPFDANGTALPNDENVTESDGNSLGDQIILKNQERRRLFTVFTDVSAFHTNNVDLIPEGSRSDSFLAGNLGAAWRPALRQDLIADLSAGASAFRYDRASELDFEKFWAGVGVTWAVPPAPGFIIFARYDFSYVLDATGNELLQDHELSLGGQKIFAFGRSHFLATGLTGIVGLSDPRSQERNQAAVHVGYHLQITRSFDVDLFYRYAAQFYTAGDRIDRNQTLSLGMGVGATRWLRVAGSISAARNDSNQSEFEYDVLNLGGGIKLEITF